MEKCLQTICFDIHCVAMSVNLLKINIAMYVALIQVIQKSQYKRFVTKLLHSPILEYAQLPKAPLVILRP